MRRRGSAFADRLRQELRRHMTEPQVDRTSVAAAFEHLLVRAGALLAEAAGQRSGGSEIRRRPLNSPARSASIATRAAAISALRLDQQTQRVALGVPVDVLYGPTR